MLTHKLARHLRSWIFSALRTTIALILACMATACTHATYRPDTQEFTYWTVLQDRTITLSSKPDNNLDISYSTSNDPAVEMAKTIDTLASTVAATAAK